MYEGLGATVTYNILKKQGDTAVTRYRDQKTVEKTINDFKARIAKIDSPEALLKDRRALEFVLTSFQLESEIGKTGILRKLLTEDPTEDKALANRLVDPRYTKLATSLSGKIPEAFQNASFVNGLINTYVTNTFEKSVGEGNTGLREALYFKRNIANVTSVSQILADKALSYVVRKGLNLPDSFAMQDFDQQKRYLEKKLDLTKFKDPGYVEKFTQRFLTQVSATESTSASSNVALQILGGGGGGLTSLLGRKVSILA
ncbi:DUF1217 domain-containing protein [Rhodocista pekingensis]|uniref:DUF1217 domain-containing protein n=1 Tax=Rhodocista pekingensis TaxID=201185 RepID=A0ABW2L055_9PROT